MDKITNNNKNWRGTPEKLMNLKGQVKILGGGKKG